MENTHISIATYDHKSIHFFALDKNEEVKVRKNSKKLGKNCKN